MFDNDSKIILEELLNKEIISTVNSSGVEFFKFL